MSKLPTRFVIAILAIGILFGATTTATIVSAGPKPFNLALAQLRAPFLAQQPQVQAPLQQPLAATSQGSFGPNCVGCITTQNLANGAITTPKIAPGAVSIATSVSASEVAISPGSDGTAFARCPGGSVITGGGFDLGPFLHGRTTGQVFRSVPNLGVNEWVVVAINPTSAPIHVTAFADCASIHP
jgi:hypothetical protein